MRVAIVGSRGYPSSYGGFETFVRRFAPYLVANGDEVTVYGRGTQARITKETFDGVEVVVPPGYDNKSLSTLTSGLTSALHAASRRFDAALVLNPANGLFLPILRGARVPTAVNVDGVEWERAKWGTVAKGVFRAGAAFAARFADRIVVDAEEIGRIWHERFGVTSTFIPYGADVVGDLPSDGVRSLGVEPGTYLLVVARLVPENNVELFLDALERLPVHTPAVIVGSANYDSPVQRRLDAVVASRPVVVATGHVDDQALLSQLWRHCGVYFHGHSVGGTNPALLQALGHGSPVLAVDTAFNREVLRHDDHLVPRVVDAVADRLAALLADDVRRAEYSVRGQSIVAERYRWDDVCARYRQTLVEIAR